MSEKNMLGSALAEVAGPLKDLAEKLGGDEGEQWLAAFKRFLRKEEPWPKPLFLVWKTIKLGTGYKTVDDFRKALDDNGFNISGLANYILRRPAFTVATEETEVDLVKVTVAELGFKKGARFEQICKRAEEFGLERCPSEVGPQLRLQYQDQPNGEWILVGMDPITDADGSLSVFSVECSNLGRWLYSDWRGLTHIWLPDYHFVFCLPRK